VRTQPEVLEGPSEVVGSLSKIAPEAESCQGAMS
jgi:hypothetical protein